MTFKRSEPFWRWLIPTLVVFLTTSGIALALFTNGDFETGTFSGWTKTTFLNTGLTGTQPFTGASIARGAGGSDQSVIVTSSPPESGVDPQLGATATLKYPKFGLDCARVNGTTPNEVSNSINQQTTIAASDVDPVDGKIHIRFAYAPVLEDPGHAPNQQPYFYFGIRNITRSNSLVYENFVFSGQVGVPWKVSPINAGVKYTDWQIVDIAPGAPTINIGDTLVLEAIGAGCSPGAHYGYVYVDAFGSQIPGLSVIKTASPSPVVNGQNVTYTFTYRNMGATTISNVVVKETIPPCAAWVSNSNPSTGTCSFGSGVVTCNVGTMAPNTSGTFTVTVVASTDLTNCQEIDNGNYTIEGTGVSPTLGPLVKTPIVALPLTVGVNKDLQNATGQIANDLEILLQGSYAAVNHYDGKLPSYAHFSTFTVTPASGGNTRLHWSSPDHDVQPNEIAHVGFNVPGSVVNILGVFWTRDGGTTGCAHQCSTHTHAWGTPGSQVIYSNNCQSCESVPLYVGSLTVEWHANQVPLGDLIPNGDRTPIRTDVIPDSPVLLAPGATATVNIPQAPPNAQFGVLIHKVGSDSTLSNPDVTTDFLQFSVAACGPDGTPCDDGDACTVTDTCQSGVCIGSGAAPNGTACNDGNPCTLTDTCQSGACIGSGAAPNGTACNDGNACTQSDSCQSGVCVGTVVPNGTACDDGNACTPTDTCQSGHCVGSGNICTSSVPALPMSGIAALMVLMAALAAWMIRRTTS